MDALLAGPADWISPQNDGVSGDYQNDPPPADGRKVILSDTDHLWGVGGDFHWVWKSFVRGQNPIYMDPIQKDEAHPEKEAERGETQKAVQEQAVYADQLTQALKALDARLADIKLRQGTLRAKARANKKGSPLSPKTSAFDDFDRMAGKIDSVEAEASLDEELGGRTAESAAAERKLNDMAAQSSVDDALAELKKKLGGGS